MAKTTKGIKISDLCKELTDLTPKIVIEKLKKEQIDGAEGYKPASVIPFGLADTIREWLGEGGFTELMKAAAAETAATEAHKPKATKKKKATAAEETPVEEAKPAEVVAPVEVPVEKKHAPEKKHEPKVAPVVHEAPAPAVAVDVHAPAVPVVEAPKVEPAPVVEAPAPVAPEVVAVVDTPAPVVPTPVEPAAPAAVKAKAHPHDGPAGHAAGHGAAHPHPKSTTAVGANGLRPTVSLRPTPRAVPPRVTQLNVPTPAVLKGPNLIREEKPEFAAGGPPRPRPRVTTPGSVGYQSHPVAGRGVKRPGDDGPGAAAAAAKKVPPRRKTLDGRRGVAEEKLKEYTNVDIAERLGRLSSATRHRADVDQVLKKQDRTHQHSGQALSRSQAKPTGVQIEEPITLRSLSAALGIKVNDLMLKLMKQGVRVTLNQSMDADTAGAIALDYGVELQVKQEDSLETQFEGIVKARLEGRKNLTPRSVVVTILGHVDHGKTSLLDKIRDADVASGEAGGITQHVAAWVVQAGGKRVTFIDTPGHRAFTAMRARGANITDVVVLVVSAAEGVQPQTIESISHARAAKVPIIVAMNKIDRADANAHQVLGQLAKEGLNPAEWGGDTEVVPTSAVTGVGIPQLIEVLDYQAQLLELKADVTIPAIGTVIEARMDEGLGPVATVLVQDGTLHVGDTVLAGAAVGRIRTLLDDRGKSITEAGPSTPVVISGLESLPEVGARMAVIEDAELARHLAEERTRITREKDLGKRNRPTLESVREQLSKTKIKEVRLIVKADVFGSAETLAQAVLQANTEEAKVELVHCAVGPISESDVELADASDAVIVGFNVAADDKARTLAEARRIQVKTYRVIYDLLDDLKKALSGLLEPEVREKYHGRLEIRQVFKLTTAGTVAGCMVTDGHILRGSRIRLIRNGTIVVENLALESLKRVKDDVKEVKVGAECGVKIAGYEDIKTQDVLEAYSRELIQRSI